MAKRIFDGVQNSTNSMRICAGVKSISTMLLASRTMRSSGVQLCLAALRAVLKLLGVPEGTRGLEGDDQHAFDRRALEIAARRPPKRKIVTASGGGQSGKAAGKIGAMVESAQATIGPECGKPDRPARESDQTCGGQQAGKVRCPQLRGNGDGGERHPSGKVLA
jgi:hypothetical protein